MLLNTANTAPTSYVTAGVEYNNENYVWIGQHDINLDRTVVRNGRSRVAEQYFGHHMSAALCLLVIFLFASYLPEEFDDGTRALFAPKTKSLPLPRVVRRTTPPKWT